MGNESRGAPFVCRFVQAQQNKIEVFQDHPLLKLVLKEPVYGIQESPQGGSDRLGSRSGRGLGWNPASNPEAGGGDLEGGGTGETTPLNRVEDEVQSCCIRPTGDDISYYMYDT